MGKARETLEKSKMLCTVQVTTNHIQHCCREIRTLTTKVHVFTVLSFGSCLYGRVSVHKKQAFTWFSNRNSAILWGCSQEHQVNRTNQLLISLIAKLWVILLSTFTQNLESAFIAHSFIWNMFRVVNNIDGTHSEIYNQ